MIIPKEKYSGTQEELDKLVNDFIALKQAHKFTTGIPAPRHHDFIEDLANRRERGEEILVEVTPTVPPEPAPSIVPSVPLRRGEMVRAVKRTVEEF